MVLQLRNPENPAEVLSIGKGDTPKKAALDAARRAKIFAVDVDIEWYPVWGRYQRFGGRFAKLGTNGEVEFTGPRYLLVEIE